MQSGTVTIRDFRHDDLETLCRIAVAAWSDIHESYRKDVGNDDLYKRLSSNWQDEKASQIREKAASEPHEILVAELDDRIVGFATFSVDAEKGLGTVCNNAVDPACQGRGIGKLQLQRIIDIFREKGLKYALVSTGYEDEGHAKARAAYEKTGFKKIKTSVTYGMPL